MKTILALALIIFTAGSSAAAITCTQLTSGGSAASASQFTTAMITPTANHLILATIAATTASAGVTPTASGTGTPYTLVSSVSVSGSLDRLTVFRALTGMPIADVIVFDFGGVTQQGAFWGVYDCGPVKTSSPVVTSSFASGAASTPSVTMGAFADPNDATVGFVGSADGGSTTMTAGSAFTLFIDGFTPTIQLLTEWAVANASPVNVVGVQSHWGGIGVEVAAATSPLNCTTLTQGQDATGRSIYTTLSVAPASNALLLALIVSSSVGNEIPTASGGGMAAWTSVGTVSYFSAFRRLTVFRALQASPSSGTLAFDFGGHAQLKALWGIVQCTGTVTTGVNGADAVRQPATASASSNANPLVTLGAFAQASNGAFGALGTGGVAVFASPGNGYAELVRQSISETDLESQWQNTNDTSVDFAVTGATNWGALGLELVAAATTTTTTTSTTTTPTTTSTTTTTICLPPGQPCRVAADCCVGSCSGSICIGCLVNGHACSSNAICCSGFCNLTFHLCFPVPTTTTTTATPTTTTTHPPVVLVPCQRPFFNH